MTLEATGANLIVGYKENTNAWGSKGPAASGGAVVVGAGDGIEVNSESVAVGASLIEHLGLSGQGTQLAAALGEKLVSGDLPCPLRYRGLEVLIAQVHGTAVAPAQQGGTAAYAHVYQIAAAVASKHGTLVMAGANHPAVREVPFAKPGGLTFDFNRGQESTLTVRLVGFDMQPHAATPDTDGLVESVEPADGAQTIAGQPSEPTRLTLTITDGDASITEFVLTIVGEDENGDYLSEVYTLSVDGLTWTSDAQFSSITSVTASGLAGTATGDTLVVGYEYGVNNVSNYSTIALPTSADYQIVTFDQVKLWANDQAAGALTTTDGSSDEVHVDGLQVSLQRELSQNVTTQHGRLVDEPHPTNFAMVDVNLRFPNWNTASHALLKDRLRGKQKKVFVQATGALADTGFPLTLEFWLNAVQFGDGSPNAGGPGDIRFDLTGRAHRVLSSPTGLPAWANTQPLTTRMINLRTSAAIS